MKYEVIVGNIGSVYAGLVRNEANRIFTLYVKQSRGKYGMAACEDVVLMRNGEPIRSYDGGLEPNEIEEL